MRSPPNQPTRRDFLGHAARLGAGALLSAAAATPGIAADGRKPLHPSSRLPGQLASRPDRLFVAHDGDRLLRASRLGDRFTAATTQVEFQHTSHGTSVRVSNPTGPLSRVVLRWEIALPADALLFGDHWERGYGDLQWRHQQPERVMPWYFAAHHAASGGTFMAGVMTQPAAMCFWMTDSTGISLWLDFRNGGGPVHPGDREIEAAVIVSQAAAASETPMAALSRFCRALCPAPRLSPTPICGNNNWYYAYGLNFDANAMRRDAAFLASLADGHPVRPYCVIDAGWTPGSACPGGPWLEGDPKIFPDMPGLAADMKALGVRPGIWMRPTALMVVDDPTRIRSGPCTVPEKPLDLTLPENLELIRTDVARVASWGYELIKHDFSTYDVFGRWGFEMGAQLTDPGWNFADRTLTNAEIILRLYRTLREGAGDSVLLGCNTVGHLGAGLFEIQRTGDDTSGRQWERTRRMGINTLAHRLPQHGAFFASDADCVAHTPQTPWELDRQFLDLVARSGTALFVSVDPRGVTPGQQAEFRAAMQTALSGGAPGGCEPLDWLHTTAPVTWRIGEQTVTYDWSEPAGAWPLSV